MRDLRTYREFIYIVSGAIGFVGMLILLAMWGIDTTIAREWLGILALPTLLGGGTYLLVKQFHRREERLKLERRSQSVLKFYLDRITALMADRGLLEADFGDPVVQVARALTISTLRELDTLHQNSLVQFLLDAHLLQPAARRDRRPTLLRQAQWSQARLSYIRLSEVDLSRADLSGAQLNGAYLQHCNLRRANLSGADLRAANLSGADLRGADLTGANLSGANLSGTSLSLANLEGGDLRGVDLSGADLSVAKLIRVNLQQSTLYGANLTSAKLMHSNLSGANLDGAVLHWSNLESAVLSGASLRGTTVESANLCGASLTNTDCSNIDLSRARYNSKTTYPQALNPEKVGMINMDKRLGLFTYI
ncbi:MAG: pentapeptide repeat-containing protein [Cyanobacteria bacterium P01_E01_bin.34]